MEKTIIIEKINSSRKTAEIIEQNMGKEFFGIEQFRAKMGIENPRSKKIEKMSWNDAKKTIQNLAEFGHIEYANSFQENFNKNMFRVRLDNEFVINYYKRKNEEYVMKFNEATFAISVINGTHEASQNKTNTPKASSKNNASASSKKVVKKAVKKPSNGRKR